MSDPTKKSTNGTVEQIIEHMTADIQNADGQYIQLGFTSPPTTNEPHIWTEYTQNQLPQNTLYSSYNPRSPDTLAYAIDSNQRYVQPNVSYNNFMPQNRIFMPDIQNTGYEKHINMDMHGNNYVVYSGQAPQYVMTNQDISMCNYMHTFSSENRDCPRFTNQEIQNIQMQQNVANNSEQLYMPEPVILQQNQEAIKNKYLVQQQSTQNRTQLIENLVGNWASNTNGTYSPFGNVPSQNSSTFFDLKRQEITPQNTSHIPDNLVTLTTETNERTTNDFNVKNFQKTNVKKQKQIAEVKPMRPTYSDVLTKSVPQQQQQQNTLKQEKIETKETKNKNQIGKKTSRNEKISKITLNRQISNSGSETKENQSFNNKTSEKTNSDQKVNLSRKWVSLDDVNEFHQNKDFLKQPDLTSSETTNTNYSTKSKKSKKSEHSSTSSANKNENKNNFKKNYHDNTTLGCQWTENEENNDNFKSEEKNFNKNPNKKVKEPRLNSARQNRFNDRLNDKPPGSAKRNQRIRKKETNSSLGLLGRNIQHYVSRWSKIIFSCILWFLHLISDIFSMSAHLTRDFGTLLWDSFLIYSKSISHNTITLLKRVKFFTKIASYIDKMFGNSRFAFWNRGNSGTQDRKNSNPDGKNWMHSGLEHNINMPTTGEEAMKRLLACKGKDPYSILGLRPDCTDDDIKRYYKRQAFLVHPDKNPQPGAEEAFKILVHAFELIGEPERRQSYDRKVAESHQVEQAWSELNDLLSQLHQKMEYAANTIRCTNCTKRHRRVSVDRPCYAARMCSQCKIHHSAKEGDIWAEATCFGFLWHYYACMDGAVYDITEWAGCQRKNLKHLRPNSHNVQYRIVLGKQAQGGVPGGSGPGGGASGTQGRRHKGGNTTGITGDREADLESFLSNLYSQSDMSTAAGAGPTPSHNEAGGVNATRNRKKNKRKK